MDIITKDNIKTKMENFKPISTFKTLLYKNKLYNKFVKDSKKKKEISEYLKLNLQYEYVLKVNDFIKDKGYDDELLSIIFNLIKDDIGSNPLSVYNSSNSIEGLAEELDHKFKVLTNKKIVIMEQVFSKLKQYETLFNLHISKGPLMQYDYAVKHDGKLEIQNSLIEIKSNILYLKRSLNSTKYELTEFTEIDLTSDEIVRKIIHDIIKKIIQNSEITNVDCPLYNIGANVIDKIVKDGRIPEIIWVSNTFLQVTIQNIIKNNILLNKVKVETLYNEFRDEDFCIVQYSSSSRLEYPINVALYTMMLFDPFIAHDDTDDSMTYNNRIILRSSTEVNKQAKMNKFFKVFKFSEFDNLNINNINKINYTSIDRTKMPEKLTDDDKNLLNHIKGIIKESKDEG